MKKIFSLIFCWLPYWLLAQTITVSEDIVLKNDVSYDIIGELKGRILLFRDRTTTFQVQAFDNQMRLVWDKELDLEKKSPKPLGVVASREDFTLVYRHRVKNHLVLRADKFDPAAKLIDTATIKDFGYLFITPNFEVIKSEDKTKMVIYYLENQQVFRAVSFDVTTMKVLWDRSFSPSEMNFWEEFGQVLVDNEGTMRVILEKNRLRLRKDEYHYEIYEANAQTEEPRVYTVGLEGKNTYDTYFAYDNLNRTIVATGLYSEKNLERAVGYFFMRFTPSNPDAYLLTFEPFDDEFVTNLMGKNIENNRGINETSIQQVVLRRDGGVLMIAERNRQLERRTGSTNRAFFDGNVRYIVDYYYDDMFMVSFNPDGKTHWKTILHKKQYSQDDNGIFSSFFLYKNPTNLRLLFNDEIKYENTVSEYVVNGSGDFERKSLLNTENLELKLRFRDALQVSATEIIVVSERRNRLKLVKLQYE